MTIPKLFGTDGVRGTAGRHPLDPITVRRLGAALVRALPHGGGEPSRLLVGRDTRESGAWIEAELAHGAAGAGASVVSAGVVPTPAVAYLTRAEGYDAGVVISASHNPFEDNGIKVFSGRGEKFTERVERQVEAVMADAGWEARAESPAVVPRANLLGAYLNHLRAVVPESLAVPRLQARRRLCQRRHDRGGARPVRQPGLRGGPDRPRAERPEHQPALRVHPPGRAGAGGGRGRRPAGRRLRRRRRSRDLRGRTGTGRERRRRAAHLRPPAPARGPVEERGRGGDRDEQHRPGAGARTPWDSADSMPGWRQVRDGGDARRRSVARRRAVRSHHLLRLPVHGGRPLHGPQPAAHGSRERPVAGRAGGRPRHVPAGAPECPGAREGGSRQRPAGRRRDLRASRRGSAATDGCSCGTPAPNRSCG